MTGGTLDDASVVYLTGADGAQPKRIFEDHDRMTEFNIASSQTLTWKGADNWDIEGVLTYPLGYQPGRSIRSILQVHGGPFGRYSATFNTGAQIWAARGYAVLQGNPRGSSGRTFAFGAANQNDWGGKDFVDIMKGVDHVVALGVADTSKHGRDGRQLRRLHDVLDGDADAALQGGDRPRRHLRLVFVLRPDGHPEPARVRVRRSAVGVEGDVREVVADRVRVAR